MSREGTQEKHSIREVYKDAEARLKEAGLKDFRSDCYLLLQEILQLDRVRFHAEGERNISPEDEEAFEQLIQRRLKHEPVQYILGKAWFYGYEFQVTPSVLIPRQDTEVLVEEALKHLEGGERILDLCTGSGCILLTIMKETAQREQKILRKNDLSDDLPDEKVSFSPVRGEGIDLSTEALEIARRNADSLGVDVRFYQSNLFEKAEGKFDLITANPPYIPTKIVDTLDPEVKEYEPHLALDGAEDGLYFYRKIIKEAKQYLKSEAVLIFEIGYDQGEEVSSLLREQGYQDVQIIRDLSENDRVAVGTWKAGTVSKTMKIGGEYV